MSDKNNNLKTIFDFIIVIIIFVLIVGVALFNFLVDPYYVFRDSTIKGINNVKTHLYTNKKTILYSDIKFNHKKQDIAFIGNCMLYHYNLGRNDVGFYTIPASTSYEILQILKAIHSLAPNIKKIYWGLTLQDLWFDPDDPNVGTLKDFDSPKFNINDFVNLFFSWNTTKYSIVTIRDSFKNKGRNSLYVYPLRDIASKKYDFYDMDKNIQNVFEAIQYAKDNGIELIMYYSPIHVTKKVHMYLNNAWEEDVIFKKKLASVTPFYDYSLLSEYNMAPLDKNSENFIDNIHLTDSYNNRVINDLINDEKIIGVLITKDNVDKYLQEDTQKLKNFMEENKELTEKIKNVKPEDANIKIVKFE